MKVASVSELEKNMNDEQRQLLSDLNDLYIDTRYESYKDNLKILLTKEYCANLIKETEVLYSWIEALI
jgi:HEPN domain-containing protein